MGVDNIDMSALLGASPICLLMVIAITFLWKKLEAREVELKDLLKRYDETTQLNTLVIQRVMDFIKKYEKDKGE